MSIGVTGNGFTNFAKELLSRAVLFLANIFGADLYAHIKVSTA
jgi:hypothetical protein